MACARDMPNCAWWWSVAVPGALILDDTYNASPELMLAALNLLSELEGRKIAVLGDMLELGPYEKQGHDLVGLRAAQVAKTLLTLGPRAHTIAEAARRAGMKASNVHGLNSPPRWWNGCKTILPKTDDVSKALTACAWTGSPPHWRALMNQMPLAISLAGHPL